MTLNCPIPSGTVVGITVVISGVCCVWLCLVSQVVPVCLCIWDVEKPPSREPGIS